MAIKEETKYGRCAICKRTVEIKEKNIYFTDTASMLMCPECAKECGHSKTGT